jgi:hypothetical protein
MADEWKPCDMSKHHWEPMRGVRAVYICVREGCGCIGYKPVVKILDAVTYRITPYKCTKCKGPTKRKGKYCTNCASKKRR